MDLLNEEKYQEKKPSKGKKIVLILLILSIISVIGIVALMVYLESVKVIPNTLFVDNEQKTINNEFIISDGSNNKYVQLKSLSEFLGYKYYSSEYQKYGTDTTKCYIKNDNLISGFEQDSNKIYKYEEGTTLDYQYYNLENNIIAYNNNLYISIADLQEALNVKCSVNQNNQIKMYTIEYLLSTYQEQLKDTGYTIAQDQNNQKAIAYDWLIVNKNGMWSVLDENLKEIIGPEYKSMYFDEFNKEYIVSNSKGQYGIIDTNGLIKQSLKYDSLEIVNYKNMLYKVENNKKYGIMKKDGTILVDIKYEEIGYPADASKKILYTLIIPNIYENRGETIVVKQNKKYGLVYLENGKEFLPCDNVEKLYSINELGETKYMVEAAEGTGGLVEYLKFRETQKVNL